MSIDQSIGSSGVIIWDGGEMVYFELIKTPPKVETILRIRAIIVTIEELVKRYKVNTIVVEQMAYGAQSTSVRMLAGLYFMIQDMCIDTGVVFKEMNIGKIKRILSGKGNASKKEMIAAAKDAYPEHFNRFVASGAKQTTGLSDLVDSLGVYLCYQKEKHD